MTERDREQIALLAARFVEASDDIQGLADMIEIVIARKLTLIEAREQT